MSQFTTGAIFNQTQSAVTPEVLNRINSGIDAAQQSSLREALSGFEKAMGGIQAFNLARNEAINSLLDTNSSSHDPSTSSVSRQLEHIVKMGYYARPSRFSFSFDALPSTVNDRLVRNCLSFGMPGRSLMSQGFKIYGPAIEQVYETIYSNEIAMTLRVGEDMMERDLFERWMNLAASFRTSDVSYPDEYMTTMRIHQLNRRDGYVYGIRLSNVFCKMLGDLEFSSDASDQLQTISVTLGYTDYAVIGRINPEQTQQQIPQDPVSGRRAVYPDRAAKAIQDLQDPVQKAANDLQGIFTKLEIGNRS